MKQEKVLSFMGNQRRLTEKERQNITLLMEIGGEIEPRLESAPFRTPE